MSETAIDRLNTALEGRYRVERELGEGGMATVYLASDLRHERKVALKVLKSELAAVVGAERFLGEIKTTANLQHPHILPLFDSGEADGFLFYVMPYVEGETLRQWIDRERQLPVDDAVRIATNLAEALDYAHRQGVIHRDIKPANVLLQDGKPVISDFGIALAVGTAGGGRLTETGLSLGTPHYMSPEQATGDQNVGRASDIYALGCVLYEMLVGEPPFTGSTPQAVLGKIITEPAASVTKQRRTVPSNVEATIGRALEKVPADRFATASDLAAALADPGFRHAGSARPGPADASRRGLTTVLVAANVLLAGALGWALLQLRESETPSTSWFDFAPDPPLVQLDGGVFIGFALTPDGRQIVYQGENGEGQAVLWRRALSGLQSEMVAGTEGGLGPSVSADGRTLAFTVPPAVKTVPLEGGPAVTVGEGRDPVWGDDGALYFLRDETAYRIPPGGGAAESWSTRARAELMAPHALPDDRGLLVTIRQSTAGFSRIAVIGADGGEPREILEGTGARHVSSGHIVYTTADGTMWAAPFDLETLEAGRAEALWEDVLVHGSSYSQFAVSASGSLIYQRTPPPRDLEIGWVDRGGTFEALGPTWSHGFGFPSISPDGSSVTFARGGNQWVRRLDDSPPVQLTFEGGQNIHASWTPEGDSVVMDLDGGIQTRKADGSGQSVTTHRPADDRTAFAPVWAPDRSWLAYRTNANLAGSGDILAIRPGRDSLPTEIVASRAVEMTPSISPDGRWLAYNSDESGRHEVYVVPFPNSVDGKWKISDGGGMSPRWDRSGRELYYVSDRAMMAVPVRLEPSFGFGAAEALFPTADFAAGFALHPLYDVAPDGRFLLRRYLGEAREGPVVIVQDFAAELERRFSR